MKRQRLSSDNNGQENPTHRKKPRRSSKIERKTSETGKYNIRVQQSRKKASEGINDPHANVINERSAKNKRKIQRNAEKQKTQLDNMSKDHIGDAGETSEYITGTEIKRQRPVSDNNGEDNSEHRKRARRCSEVRRHTSAQPRKKASKRND